MSRIFLLLLVYAVFDATFSKAEKFFIAGGDVAGLITAIQQANQNNEADTIYLALKGKYVFTGFFTSPFDGRSALPDVMLDQTLTNKIIVYGNGSSLERDAGAPNFRIWLVGTGSLELHDVVIRNGYLDGITAGNHGGGIANYRELAVHNSTFVNNTGAFLGGALYISVSSPTELVNCTITGNKAAYGSAVYFYSSSASVTNCTITDNKATVSGGAGLYNQLNLDDPNRRVFLKNSIVAMNTNNNGSHSDVYGVFISRGRNLVGANDDVNAHVYLPLGMPNVTQDYVGTSTSPVDPMLNALADNGGLTPTLYIQSDNSLAFNNGGLAANATTTDQAGNYRIGNAEIGSMEYNNNPALNPFIAIRQNSTALTNGGTFDFHDVTRGQSSGPKEFKIHNTGFFQKLKLLGKPKVMLTGTHANEFIVDQSVTAQEVDGGAATSFFVTFTPASPGAKSATLSIASNDTGNTIFTIQLAGTGISSPSVIDTGLGVTAVSPLCEGSPASVAIKDSESGVDYRVFKGITALSGTVAGGGDLAIPLTASLPAGDHTLKVLGTRPGAGSDTLITKPLVHVDALTAIIDQPSGETKLTGQSVTFTVTAAGTGLSYQWRRESSVLQDDTKFSGSMSPTLTISNLAVADEGDYNCVVTGTCGGSITSGNATLIVGMITGVEDQPGESVIVFPNPSANEITVTTAGADRLVLSDSRGVVIREWQTAGTTITLDIGDASPGWYLLKAQRGNDVVFISRIVKR